MTYTQAENMTGIYDIFVYANNVTGNIFGTGVLVAMYVVIFAYLHARGEEYGDCMMVSGFITAIAGIMLFLAGLVVDKHLYIIIMLCVLPALWNYFRKSR